MQKVTQAIVHIFCSINNTIITVTNNGGDAIFTVTAGMCGLKGHRRSSGLAANQVAQKTIAKMERLGIKNVAIQVKGIGQGRDYALEAFGKTTMRVNSVKDVTPIPHNGVKSRKVRK